MTELSLVLDKCATFLLALCPILQHYKGLFVNAAVTVLLLLFPYVMARLVKNNGVRIGELKIILPLIAFFLYQVVDHGTSITEAGQAVVVIVYFLAITACLDTAFSVRVITAVALLASFCIAVQYVCYYTFDFHLQLVPTSLLIPRAEQWVLLAQTGRYSVTGKLMRFYRPSAFFLEPSHMFIYMFTPTALQLLSDKPSRTRMIPLALMIGMVLTTSGMAILTAAMLFLLFVGKKSGKRTKEFSLFRFLRVDTISIIAVFGLLCIAAFFTVPFLRNSVERIFSSGQDYSNAVSGRIASGWNVLKTMHGWQILFGVQDGLKGITASMSGFYETMFEYGVIGILISYAFFVHGLFNLKNEYFWVACIMIIASFFSQHTHSTMFLIYATFVFVDGYRKRKSETTGIAVL